jgi:hypothetical protein
MIAGTAARTNRRLTVQPDALVKQYDDASSELRN